MGSVAGWIWGIIHPLVLLASWTFVFSICLHQRLPPGQPGNYPLFLFAGMLPWLLFSETVQRSSSSLLDHASLITKTVFPAEMVPLSVFLSSLVSHLMALVLLIAAIEIWLRSFSPAVIVLPLYIVLLGMLAVGIGWIVAALQVYLQGHLSGSDGDPDLLVLADPHLHFRKPVSAAICGRCCTPTRCFTSCGRTGRCSCPERCRIGRM